MAKPGYVYMMTNHSRHSLYIGVTADLERRVGQHRSLEIEGFTKLYKCTRLVLIEEFGDIRDAIAREKVLKGWTRGRKDALVSARNPKWADLAEAWFR